MEDGVVAVLPALVQQPVRPLAAVFDEAVPVRVAVPVDPAQRRLDVRPQDAQRGQVAGSVEIGAGQHDEERGGVGAAIVAAERHLAEQRHLALPRLMQDLAGLGIGRRVFLRRLMGGQEAEHAAGQGGAVPEGVPAAISASRPKAVLYQGMPA
ncbi:hypothetical protein [Teichococcus aestuarii]|uniref:hypothetical protein n=1 Tax=Teichococcus aestuarii TaxID=568898 RepID=UPI0036070FD7